MITQEKSCLNMDKSSKKEVLKRQSLERGEVITFDLAVAQCIASFEEVQPTVNFTFLSSSELLKDGFDTSRQTILGYVQTATTTKTSRKRRTK